MKIFLSYPSEQFALCDQIRQGLINAGHEVFFDRQSLPSAGDYVANIAAQLESSDAMIFVVTRRSVADGSYTRTELKLAARRWPSPVNRVLPVEIEPVPISELPAYLKSVTLLQPEGNPVAETVDALETMVKDHPAAAQGLGQQLVVVSRSFRTAFRLRAVQLLAGAIVLITLAFVLAPALQAAASTAVAMARVRASSTRPPISDELRMALEGTAKRLASVVQADALGYEHRQITPWAFAQATWALPEASRFAPTVMAEYVRKEADPSCACWRELIDKPGDKGVFISGWVLAAMARQGVQATPAEIDFLLRQQQPGGWWAMFPAPSSPTAASPYATSWALMGLHLQRQLPGFPASQRKAADSALSAGRAWLMTARVPGAARWKRYPALPTSDVSVSVSGTVLHALHLIGSKDLAPIDALWIGALPDPTGIVGEAENPYVIIETSDGQATDYWEQLKFPWLMAATLDAYRGAEWVQRAHAWQWMEALLKDPRLLASDTEQRQWWRAEILYGLLYVLGVHPSAGPPN
jgi:hypothetical protein